MRKQTFIEDAKMKAFVRNKIQTIKQALGEDQITLTQYISARKEDRNDGYSPKENYYFEEIIKEDPFE